MELLCGLTCLACFAFVVLLVPTLASGLVEGEWRHRWVRSSARVATLDVAGQGAFRAAPIRARVPTSQRDRAPCWVRFVAFTCWLLAQPVVPWFIAGATGLCMAVDASNEVPGEVQLLAIPMTAWALLNAWGSTLLWRAGSALVRGEGDRADQVTTRTAKVVAACNVPVAWVILCWQVADRHDLGPTVLALCCLAPVAHALAVRSTFLHYREEYTPFTATAAW